METSKELLIRSFDHGLHSRSVVSTSSLRMPKELYAFGLCLQLSSASGPKDHLHIRALHVCVCTYVYVNTVAKALDEVGFQKTS